MRPREDTDAALDRISEVMMACIERGLNKEGILPGGLETPMVVRSSQRRPTGRPGLFRLCLNIIAAGKISYSKIYASSC